jgi:hypothetical protein
MEAAAERERMSDWLVAYHENRQDLDGKEDSGGTATKRG